MVRNVDVLSALVVRPQQSAWRRDSDRAEHRNRSESLAPASLPAAAWLKYNAGDVGLLARNSICEGGRHVRSIFDRGLPWVVRACGQCHAADASTTRCA